MSFRRSSIVCKIRILKDFLPKQCTGEPRVFFSVKELASECRLFLSASRYEQTRVARTWLFPLLQTYISKGDASSSETMLRVFCTATELYRLAKCYQCILDVGVLNESLDRR